MVLPSHPFEASAEQLEANVDLYVDNFIASLQSFFLVMPKGNGFVEFPRFQEAYLVLKKATANFRDFSEEAVLAAIRDDPLVLVVLRSTLGLSPPEFAYVASAKTGV